MKIGDILVICLLVLLFWGPARLSGLARGLGDGIRNFKKGLRGNDGSSPDGAPEPREVPKS
jgi:sec-independent protein translocase protein TatA